MAKNPGKLAQRYAKALLKAANERASLDQLATQLSDFSSSWKASADLRNAILNPMFTKSDRLRALLALATVGNLSELAKKFLLIVFERDRIVHLPEIAAAFLAAVRALANIVQVNITVAREVAREEARQIEFDLQQHIPGTLEFSWAVDPGILGGMIVSYAGNVLDGSLDNKLSRMERQLLAA